MRKRVLGTLAVCLGVALLADACGSIKLQERETCLEFLKLLLYLLF